MARCASESGVSGKRSISTGPASGRIALDEQSASHCVATIRKLFAALRNLTEAWRCAGAHVRGEGGDL